MNPTWRNALLLVSHPELSTHSSMSQRFQSPDSCLQPSLVFVPLEYSPDQSDAMSFAQVQPNAKQNTQDIS